MTGKVRMGYRGRQILALMERNSRLGRRQPTYREIGEELDMSKVCVCLAIRRLEACGYLHRRAAEDRRARGWHRPVIVLGAEENEPGRAVNPPTDESNVNH